MFFSLFLPKSSPAGRKPPSCCLCECWEPVHLVQHPTGHMFSLHSFPAGKTVKSFQALFSPSHKHTSQGVADKYALWQHLHEISLTKTRRKSSNFANLGRKEKVSENFKSFLAAVRRRKCERGKR